VPLEPSVELEHHARVELDGDDGLDSDLEEALGKVARSRTDLKNGVGGLEAGLRDYGVHQRRITQDMLPLGLLERDPALQACAAARSCTVALLLDLAASHDGRGSSSPAVCCRRRRRWWSRG
jgi:hypothetical protein